MEDEIQGEESKVSNQETDESQSAGVKEDNGEEEAMSENCRAFHLINVTSDTCAPLTLVFFFF